MQELIALAVEVVGQTPVEIAHQGGALFRAQERLAVGDQDHHTRFVAAALPPHQLQDGVVLVQGADTETGAAGQFEADGHPVIASLFWLIISSLWL